jgi:hypothetical protein
MTLDQIIDLYDKPPNSDGTADPLMFPLGLSSAEKADLKAFLLALSEDMSSPSPPASQACPAP